MNVYTAFERKPLWFKQPCDLVSCYGPSSLKTAFEKIERWLDAGFHAAGFLSYEAGYCFEPRFFPQSRANDFPLLRMAAYRCPDSAQMPPAGAMPFKISRRSLSADFSRYAGTIRRIRRFIAAGDVYQITFCVKNHFRFHGSARRLFDHLYRQQPVPYSAFIETDDYSILSLSPERFIRKNGEHVLTEPMKGTWPRGTSPNEDQRMRRAFSSDPKNRAENVMIADLLRNDLGRIGHSIRAPKLFTVSAYKTLFQMTSTITGIVPKTLGLYDLFHALFPSGSVTGAPKIRAMQIIREIEPAARKIYTGAIGYITPDRDLYFNIPIRTLLIRGAEGEMGVGGGIVWDSTARGEWQEGLLKSKFLKLTSVKKAKIAKCAQI